MHASVTVSQKSLLDFMLNVAVVRPVFVWGPPGVGKSAIVEQFATSLGFECVSLLGSQLAPEDVSGVPQIRDGKSYFCPPELIARDSPYVLFLDELNACSLEVQKAFYSLIHERRVGAFKLHPDTVVIGAGNRGNDSAIVKNMSSALLNRMVHVHLQAKFSDWHAWACTADLDPLVLDYLTQRPDHLLVSPPTTQEPFSTPRSWHMLSDGLKSYGETISRDELATLAHGCLTPSHAVSFVGFSKLAKDKFALAAILKGDRKWPARVDEIDLLYFLAHSFRAHLLKNLPDDRASVSADARELAHVAKKLMLELASLNFEVLQQVVVKDDEGNTLPAWFMAEIVRDLPRLAAAKA